MRTGERKIGWIERERGRAGGGGGGEWYKPNERLRLKVTYNYDSLYWSTP